MFSVLAVLVAGVGYMAYQMGSFGMTTNYSKSWIQNQLGPLRTSIKSLGVTLLNLPPKEWVILSAGVDEQKSGFFGSEKTSTMTTLFHEPLVLIATRSQPFSFGKSATIMQLADLELAFIKTQSSAAVYLNEEPFAEIVKLDMRTRQGIHAKIVDMGMLDDVSLYVNNVEIAKLIKKSAISNAKSTRVVSYLDLSQEDAFVRALPLVLYYTYTELAKN